MKRPTLLSGAGVLALGGAGAAYVGTRPVGSMEHYDASVAATRAALSKRPELQDFVHLATLAPSGHNTQPWRFQIGEDRIDVLPDLSRRTPVVDPHDHHLFVSLGCAVENLAIAASANGHAGNLAFNAAGDGAVGFVFGDGPADDLALAGAITRRQSTRANFDGR